MPDNTEVYERLRTVENAVLQTGMKVETVERDVHKLEVQKIDPLCAQVADIHDTVTRSNGFIGGAIMTIGAIWAIISIISVAAWKWITGH